MRSLWLRFVGFLFSIGEYPEESLEQRARRGIFVGVAAGATVLTIPFVFEAIDAGQTQIAISLGLVSLQGFRREFADHQLADFLRQLAQKSTDSAGHPPIT